MKAFLVFGLLMSAVTSFAQSALVHIQCTTPTPCKYEGKGMKHCLSGIEVSGSANGMGQSVVYFKPAKLGYEVKLLPQSSAVNINTPIDRIIFSSRDRNQWGFLQASFANRYSGKITIERSFEFDVTCVDKSIDSIRFE